MKNTNKKRKFLICISSILASLLLIFGGCTYYLMDYYPAQNKAIAAFSEQFTVEKTVWEDGTIVYEPNGARAGFIFYPGGKVEHTAYQPLMQALAEQGILTVLVEMPFRLAVLDVNAANGIQALFPNIDKWYIGGHSLGGAMAAQYVSNHLDLFDGLVLLAAYSKEDLSHSNLKVLSLYGSNDTVLNKENYQQYKKHLPENYTEIRLEGGCHAYFGMYGEQNGDGKAGISPIEQITQSANAIAAFIGNGANEK